MELRGPIQSLADQHIVNAVCQQLNVTAGVVLPDPVKLMYSKLNCSYGLILDRNGSFKTSSDMATVRLVVITCSCLLNSCNL